MSEALDLARAEHGVDGASHVVGGDHLRDGAVVVEDHHLGGEAERHVRHWIGHVGSGGDGEVADVLAEVFQALELCEVVRLEVGGQLAGRDLGRGAE